ncbi:Retrovirus-related Pol polyprotein from transposon 297 [Vitis vinifera]|uniref:Retrovirus-related Pol polyprotein from transposon 297 n=1 Tax=Vitis vinifera TaxID=29760 RepID=A0A438CNB5_VITVI|nr:Retrovirus-related Pol polyprotein from transposon 297 [Vitis vinifera]
MQNILRRNHDIFAWAHSDMRGIHPSIASHKLNVFPAARPVRQKIRRFHPDRQRVIRSEIDKLLAAGFIREVSYPDWLANVVVRIDQIVDSTSGQRMLSFLDAFSGYHQIPMSPDDEKKTAFITPHDLYCYKVMPFGLKNAGATYQRLMTKIFKPLIGHTVEVYIDDIVVKSRTREQHVLHLQEVFHLLRKYGMKLNPSKCAFGVSAGKFLGFMVSQRGIEVSPDQVKAVIETSPPRNKKELQRLTGKLVALGRFIARFTDELRPFFLAIRKLEHTDGRTVVRRFRKDQACLMQPPILSSLIPKEKLYMYLAVSKWAISAVLFRCPSPKEQKPIYYVSRALADVEIRYSRRPSQHHESSKQEWWTLRVDGASRSSGSGVGLLLQSPTGEHLEQAIRLGFPASNSEAEYEAILSGLDLALALSVSKLRIYNDSQLVVKHVKEEYEAKDARMTRYLAKVRNTLQQFTEWTIEKIKRADNGRVDALAGRAASLPIKEAILLPIHVQANPSNISGQELYPEIPNKHTSPGTSCPFHPDWGTPVQAILHRTLLRCLGHSEAQYVIAELHEGICGIIRRTISGTQAHSQGYYWQQ